MSSETDQPNAEAPVLTHKAATPAIPVTSQPTPEELAFDWTLSPKDIRLVLKHRATRICFALPYSSVC
jgi:hypothetical protein